MILVLIYLKLKNYLYKKCNYDFIKLKGSERGIDVS